jgi:hypothetical protein
VLSPLNSKGVDIYVHVSFKVHTRTDKIRNYTKQQLHVCNLKDKINPPTHKRGEPERQKIIKPIFSYCPQETSDLLVDLESIRSRNSLALKYSRRKTKELRIKKVFMPRYKFRPGIAQIV